MKHLLLIIFMGPFIAGAQRTVVYKDSFELKQDFKSQVEEGMRKHHRKYYPNEFYSNNVVKTPTYVSDDTLRYNVKFLAASKLWGGDGLFYKSNGKLVCQVSNMILLKKSSMSGIDYINVAVNDMENTKGNRINLVLLQEEVERFFKKFK